MTASLVIGGEKIEVSGPAAVVDLISQRFGPFVQARSCESSSSPIFIEVANETRTSSIIERVPNVRITASGPDQITVDGAMTAHYFISARRGFIARADNLGHIDAMLRLVLSVALPLSGAVLMHGAALNNPLFGAIAVCGDSGAGKSTAAAAFGAACDELIVLRPENENVQLSATPYWRGTKLSAPCQTVVCLLRGGEPTLVHERGMTAMRRLARHVIRHVSIEPVDRAILQLLSLICKNTALMTARCPEGAAFIPYLSEKFTQMLHAAA